MNGDFPRDLERTVERVKVCKDRITAFGWHTIGEEPMKITVAAYKSGITGDDLADRLREYGIEPNTATHNMLCLCRRLSTARRTF